METKEEKAEHGEVVPLYGRDEMNLIEFPFGPITVKDVKTFEITQLVYDRTLRREVERRMLITGSDAFGLPRPVDEQVLLGLQTLTYEAGYTSRKVSFSRYQLCRILGWEPDGRAYKRLEESFDRLTGTTLKYKDAWWDKGEKEWRSKTFHVIEEAELCSRDRLDRTRAKTGTTQQSLCYFVWGEVLWKSLQDGFIKKLDMRMFRTIAKGKRKDVAVRLYRLLDKRLHKKDVVQLQLRRLCVEKLGLCETYSPSQMRRVIERAGRWLVQCKYLDRVHFAGNDKVVFVKGNRSRGRTNSRSQCVEQIAATRSEAKGSTIEVHCSWLSDYCDTDLCALEEKALTSGFGTEFERQIVQSERRQGIPLRNSRLIRIDYVRKFLAEKNQSDLKGLMHRAS